MLAALATSVALNVLFGVLLYVTQRRRGVERRAATALGFASVSAALRCFGWYRWWTRNAAEMTKADGARPHLVRLAYAAQLATDLRTFGDDCDRIAADVEGRDSVERNAAASFAQELRAARVPWEVWAETTGKAPHAAGSIALAYREAMAPPRIPSGMLPPPLSQVSTDPG